MIPSGTTPARRPSVVLRTARGAATPPALALAFALALGGCATVQPPAAEPVADVDVADIQRAPPPAPVPVRWGGTITRIVNTEGGTTELEVVARPLGRGGRPRHVDASPGRFVAEIDRFLDPEIVREGRDVTVTGTVGELREGKVGRAGYRFPVVAVRDFRYWRPARTPPPGPYGPYGAYVPYGYGPYGHVPYGVPLGYGPDPFSFQQRFWHDFWHDPIHPHRRDARGGRTGVGVTVRP